MQELSCEKGMLYWAYDSTMNHDRMMRICPDAVNMGVATLGGYRLAWCTRHGWPSFQRKPSGCVHGVLWHIPPDSVMELTNAPFFDGYDQTYVTVRGKQGQQRATAFLLSPRMQGYAKLCMPSFREIWDMQRAYKQNSIPIMYLRRAQQECRKEMRESSFQLWRRRKRKRVYVQTSFPASFHCR